MSGVATAVVGGMVVSSVISANEQSKAAGKAAAAQERGAMASIAEQRRQFDSIQEMLKPYVESGEGALAAQMNLLGLGGEEAKAKAIQSIEQGPEFAAMVQQGENAMLQNAAATGGVRGGNTQSALAQFRPQVLNQLVGQQYARLGDAARVGQASAVQQGAAGQQMAGQIGQQYTNIGDAQAQAALVRGQANAAPWQAIQQLGGAYLGSKF